MIFSIVISFEINTLSIFYGFFFFNIGKKNEMRRFLRRNKMRAAYWKQTCFFFFSLRGGEWVHCLFLFPCFRENVVATYKIGSFLCSLDNLLQKNVIVLIFGNQVSKWRSFEKRAIFDLLFTFFSHQGKLQKFLQHISHSHTYMYFAHPIDFFALPILEKKYEYIRYGFSLVWFLVLILICAILEQSINNKKVSKT